jgi:glycosyltransferase involved in cell wall biosynthesis
MLIHDLGYRRPPVKEVASVLIRQMRRRSEVRGAAPAEIPATVLSAAPLISYSGIVPGAVLGIASLAPRIRRGEGEWFLANPTWSIETGRDARAIRHAAVLNRLRNPSRQLLFVCNCEAEAALLREKGEAAFFCSHAVHVSEAIFRPLPGSQVEFDAVYNAQLAPWKRHELALAIGRCAFVFYRDFLGTMTREWEAAVIARHAALSPGHVFINTIGPDGAPVRLPPAEVNRQLNRAAVGLCLSETEGAMLASVEYLLAGLPVVSTASKGGRDAYFDNDYCAIAPPQAAAVAEAVAALKARRIPPDYIRSRTLARIERDRRRFIDLLNDILVDSGAVPRFSMPWPFEPGALRKWLTPADAIRLLRA